MTGGETIKRIDALRRIVAGALAEMDALRDALAADIDRKSGSPIEVVVAVAAVVGIAPDDILAEGRSGHVVRSRAVVCLVLREVGMSSPEVGRLVRRDHSSVLAAAKMAPTYMSTGPRAGLMTQAYHAGWAAWRGSVQAGRVLG